MIVVTGGAGFIGSNIVQGLNRSGVEDIIVVDNLKYGEKHLNLNSLRFADYIDKDDFLVALPKLGHIDYIFHQGACSDTTEQDGRFMMKNNYEFSKKIFIFSQKHSIDLSYASSASVYGSGDNGFEEIQKCEYPLNVYAFSKFSFDNYVRKYMHSLRSRVVGFRYFNVYGPQESHKGNMVSMPFQLLRSAMAKKPMELFEGSNRFKRDFIHVDDVVSINLHFMESDNSGIYNCGTGIATSFLDLAQTINKLTHSDIEYIPFPQQLAGKYQEFTRANTDHLRAGGYDKEFISLEQGVSLYHDCLVKNGGFYL